MVFRLLNFATKRGEHFHKISIGLNQKCEKNTFRVSISHVHIASKKF